MSKSKFRYGGGGGSTGQEPRIVNLMEKTNVSTSATSVSCYWTGYDLLVFEAVSNGNINGTVVVPPDWFAATTASVRVLVTDPINNKHYQVYQNGDSSVYILGNEAAASGRGVRMYGITFGG